MKFNNLGLTLDINLKFYTSDVKRLKMKFRKFRRVIPTFIEVTAVTSKQKTGRGPFLASPYPE